MVATSARAWMILMSSASIRPAAGAEQVQGADDVVAVPQREGVHGAVPGADRLRREPRPPSGGAGQVGVDHRSPEAEAVPARALLGLQLEQLQHLDRLRRCGHELQVAVLVRQHQPGGVGAA